MSFLNDREKIRNRFGQAPSPAQDRAPSPLRGFGRAPSPAQDRSPFSFGGAPSPAQDRAPSFGRAPSLAQNRDIHGFGHGFGFGTALSTARDRPPPMFARAPSPAHAMAPYQDQPLPFAPYPPSVGLFGGPKHEPPHWSDSEEEGKEGVHPDNTTITIPLWRMDPQESFSDWTTEVSSSSGSSSTYHVHKNVIAAGDRKCNFFARLFQNIANGQQFSEFKDNTSRHKFEQKSAIDAFPAFLDFLYLADKKFTVININNAVALYFLAEYFDCRRLRRDIRQFIVSDLGVHHSDSLATFYENAKQFHNEVVIDKIAGFCAMYPGLIDPYNSIVNIADKYFWLKVLSRSKGSENGSKQLSHFIAAFCAKENQHLDLVSFAELTDESKLPHLHHQAAIQLLAIQQKLISAASSEATDESTINNLQDRITNLQDRCFAALTSHCSELDMDKVSDLVRVCVDKTILIRLLKAFHVDIQR